MLVLGGEDGVVWFLDREFRFIYKSQVHASPVLSIRAHNLGMGIRKETTSQGITITFKDVVVLLSVEELLHMHQNMKTGQRTLYDDIDFAKYDLSSAISGMTDAVTVGYTSFSLRQLLMGTSWESKKRKIRVLACGVDPALLCVHVEKNQNANPNPLLSTALELVPLPFVSRLTKKIAGTRNKEEDAQMFSSKVPFVDPNRHVFSLTLAPDYPLVACCDSLGRVLVIDATNFVVKKVFKGYRDAATGWLYSLQTRKLYLIILSPKRLRVEVWDVFEGKPMKHLECKQGDFLCKPACAILIKPSTEDTLDESCILKASLGSEGLRLSMIKLIYEPM